LWGDSNIKGDRATGLKAFIKRLYVGRVVRSVTGVLVCGRLGKAYFARYGAREPDMFLYPVEPDYDLITQLSPQVIEGARMQFSLAPGRHRLIYSGRLAPEKRVDLLLTAFSAIASDRPDWDLVIAGGGPLEAQLRASVPALLAGRILWAGFVDKQETVSALYHLSDVLALPSDYEPWSLAINEGVAAGLAIVCSDAVGAAAELVRDGVNGRVFPAGDVEALKECLLDVTAPANTSAMKAASAPLLAEWRRVADPVDGLRKALASVNVLHTPGAAHRDSVSDPGA
jgi:glycosyltransferase involved in cell wall biosynthesis